MRQGKQTQPRNTSSWLSSVLGAEIEVNPALVQDRLALFRVQVGPTYMHFVTVSNNAAAGFAFSPLWPWREYRGGGPGKVDLADLTRATLVWHYHYDLQRKTSYDQQYG